MAGRNCTRRGSSSFGSLDSVAGSFQDFSARFSEKNIIVALQKLIMLINKNKKTEFVKFKKKSLAPFSAIDVFLAPVYLMRPKISARWATLSLKS
jgi:hypothetical protein